MSGPEDPRRDGGQPSPPLFALTRWSLVQRAQQDSITALNDLFTQYRGALIRYLRIRGHPADRAEDLVQGFCVLLLRRQSLNRVEPSLGRFRTWLLNALQNHLRDEHARGCALKRGAGQRTESLDATLDDGAPAVVVASDSPGADVEYDRAWAEALLANAIRRLGAECAGSGHAALFDAVEPALFGDETAMSYQSIAERLEMTEGAVKVAVHRIRGRLRRIIREEVQQTVGSAQDWEDELRHLISLFQR